MKPKLALVGPWDRLIWTGRKALISEMIQRGWEVVAIGSVTPGQDYVARIESLGARFIPVQVARFIDPITDAKYLVRLVKILRRERCDLVHTFTIKPNLFGTVAARIARVPKIVSLVEGFGYGYREGSHPTARCLRGLFFAALKVAFLLSHKVWFLNRDDLRECESLQLLTPGKGVMIASCGVDTNSLKSDRVDPEAIQALRRELGGTDKTQFVICVGRMNWPKGVREYVEASRLVAKQCQNSLFVLVGEIQPGSPFSVPREYLLNSNNANFRWLDFRHDVKELMALADVVVLPTYYREGVPLVLLEGLSLGKPIVATDWVGCREAVIDGVNGFLVPIKDEASLAGAISRLLRDSSLRMRMGNEGRQMAEKQFDEKDIARRVVAQVYGVA